MSTARWELQTEQVPIASVKVFAPSPPLGSRVGGGFHIQFGSMLLWVQSQSHWEDIAEQIAACFADLAPARPVPLPRTANVNVAGACYSGEDE